MVRVVAVVLLVLSALGAAIGIKLDGNGYTDLLIAINPAVPQNDELINRIKIMITDGSEYLHQALDNKVFIKEVKILVPPNWNGSYEKARRETYDKVQHFNQILRLRPYTKQMKGCGEEGEYVHLTPNFLLDDSFLKSYGPRGETSVHVYVHVAQKLSWQHYSPTRPFQCSGRIAGKLVEVVNGSALPCYYDPKTSLPTEGCQFLPDKYQQTNASIMYIQSLDSVKTFCGDEEHNTEAPNQQNKECNFRSTRSVIYKHSVDSAALQTLTPVPSPSPPTFREVQRRNRVICLILDVSGSMAGGRILRQQQAATLFLSEIVEEGAYVGIVQFSNDASIRNHLTKIKGKASRDTLIRNLPTSAGGGTYMCKGLLKSFEVRNSMYDGETIGDDVIFLTDGEASDNIQNCFKDAVNSSAIINTLALGPSASVILKNMADETACSCIKLRSSKKKKKKAISLLLTLRVRVLVRKLFSASCSD
uniref:VWFA domain-containing protein n=1 Tax=Astyanax mexicanus TaxID=7994 RepID=A0A3B1J396_ASTMX